MAEGSNRKWDYPERDDDDEVIEVSFVDTSYRVPYHVARKIHRISLLLDDNPGATELFFQEMDQGRFAQTLDPQVSCVDPALFLGDAKPQDKRIEELCKTILLAWKKSYTYVNSNSIVRIPIIGTVSTDLFRIA